MFQKLSKLDYLFTMPFNWRMNDDRQVRLTRELRLRGSATATELASAIGISQPTVSRTITAAGDRILRIGRARSTRYALTREIGRAGGRWPLFRIDAGGRGEQLGELRALHEDAFHFQADGDRPALLTPPFESGLFPGLPWFLDDLRPQGFLGRALAQRVATDIGAGPELALWRVDDIALALLRHGSDLPGDLVLGEAMLQQAQNEALNPINVLQPDQRDRHYPTLALAALQGQLAGSSAGGEQPKFTVTVSDRDQYCPMIVKFSDRRDSPGGQRWSDLLRCEHVASTLLADAGLRAASNEIVEADGRTFLQSSRFDRTPQLGRCGLLSLAALDAAFYGHGRIDWPRFAEQLALDGWISRDDAQALRRIGWFGALIGNSDMHLGNVSLILTDARPLALAPVYDMLPMQFRPAVSGEIVPRRLVVDLPLPKQRDDWQFAATIAREFWQHTADAAEVSPSMRDIAGDALQHLVSASNRA